MGATSLSLTSAQVARSRANLERLTRRLEGWYAANEYDYGQGEPWEITRLREKVGFIRARLRAAGVWA